MSAAAAAAPAVEIEQTADAALLVFCRAWARRVGPEVARLLRERLDPARGIDVGLQYRRAGLRFVLHVSHQRRPLLTYVLGLAPRGAGLVVEKIVSRRGGEYGERPFAPRVPGREPHALDAGDVLVDVGRELRAIAGGSHGR